MEIRGRKAESRVCYFVLLSVVRRTHAREGQLKTDGDDDDVDGQYGECVPPLSFIWGLLCGGVFICVNGGSVEREEEIDSDEATA